MSTGYASSGTLLTFLEVLVVMSNGYYRIEDIQACLEVLEEMSNDYCYNRVALIHMEVPAKKKSLCYQHTNIQI